MTHKSLILLSTIVLALQIIGADAKAHYVWAEDRLSIAQSQDSVTWEGRDLSVAFSYSKYQGQWDVSGTIEFSFSMIMNYSSLQNFQLAVIFVDENGRVLEETGLATGRGSFDPISFHRQISLPAKTAFIAFHYQGTAIASGHHGGGGPTSFWFYPVHR